MLSTSFRKSFFAWRFTQKKQICKLLSWFNAKTICRNYICSKNFILVVFFFFFFNQSFSLFSHSENECLNSAEICRVDNLEADFHEVSRLFHFFFLKSSQYCCETSIIQIQQRKVKIFPLTKLKQEDHDGPISLTWANRFAYLLLKFQPSSLLRFMYKFYSPAPLTPTKPCFFLFNASWKRVTKGTFLPSYIEIGRVVSDKKIFKVFYIVIKPYPLTAIFFDKSWQLEQTW